ncbi:hypothetical protein GQX74_009436 [Glossina fuscipes]|nr:hypothetical protein GQX74_009436 [Glossina fuscipes]
MWSKTDTMTPIMPPPEVSESKDSQNSRKIKILLAEFVDTYYSGSNRPYDLSGFTILSRNDQHTEILGSQQNKRRIIVYVKRDSFHSAERLFETDLNSENQKFRKNWIEITNTLLHSS